MSDDLANQIANGVRWINAAEAEIGKVDPSDSERRAELAAIQRLGFRRYLDGLADYLGQAKQFPTAAIQPLIDLADKIASIDNSSGPAPVFVNREPTNKPVNRLLAEGHVVGCVIYLTEVLGDKTMFACKSVGSMFGHIGHRGRIRERLHTPQKQGLSASTVHQWYSELGSSVDEVESATCLRQLAKINAFEALCQAERDRPIMHLPTTEFRVELASRIMDLATKTLIEGGSGWKRQLPDKSE